MSDDLSTKIDRIYTLLVGVEGLEEEGFVHKTNKTFKQHDSRLTRLERVAWGFAGIIAFVGFLATIVKALRG